MEHAEIDRQVKVLLMKRAGVLNWPDGPTRETVLKAIDDVIVKLEMSELSTPTDE